MKSAVSAMLFAVAGLAPAGDQPGPANERLRQFQRDLPLIQALVKESITLAAEEDPLKRARSCNGLAETLVREIQQAAGQRDGKRAANLGEHLQAVLVRGVAGNLDLARSKYAADAGREPEFKLISEQVQRVTQPVAEEVKLAPDTEQKILQPAMAAARAGRAAVEKALKKRTP